MNRIMFLLTALTFVSCSRIATADYEILDSGVVTGVDEAAGRVHLVSDSDGVCRKWFSETLRDGLSLWTVYYADSLAVGDKCYVYDGGNRPIISKVSVANAHNINQALCQQYRQDSLMAERLAVYFFMALVIAVIRRSYLANSQRRGLEVMLILATTAVAVVLACPGRRLEKIGSGVITDIAKKRCTLDGKMVYYQSSPRDVFNDEMLEVGNKVNVYRYGGGCSAARESIFLSRSCFNEATLEKTQIYPEIFLWTVGFYWLMLVIIGGVMRCIDELWNKLRRKKPQP